MQREVRISSSFATRMQYKNDAMMIFNKFFENVAISNIREPHEQIQVAYMKKLKSFVNSGVLATCILWLRLFFPPVCYLKTSKFEVHKIIILPAVLYWYKIWLFTV